MQVSEHDTATFEAARPRLFGIAYRMLGSREEADDVVQEAWLRWQRTDREPVRDPAAFLAKTTTSRIGEPPGLAWCIPRTERQHP